MRKKILIYLFVLFISITLFGNNNSLKILKALPQGELKTMNNLEIVIVFSDDIKALGEKKDISTFVKISPEINGKLFWRGNSTIVFKPAKRFKYSTMYEVILKRGLKSLGGKTLLQDYRFSFTTPRPYPIGIKQKTSTYLKRFYKENIFYSEDKVEYNTFGSVRTDEPLFIRFNQNIKKQKNLSKISCYDRYSLRKIKIKTSFSSEDTIQINFLEKLNKLAKYFIKIDKGFESVEGNLSTNKKIIINFKTEDFFRYEGEKEISIFKENKKISLIFNKRIEKNGKCHSKNLISVYHIKNLKKRRLNRNELSLKCFYNKIILNFKEIEDGYYLIEIPKNFQNSRGEKLSTDLKIRLKVCGVLPDINVKKFENRKLYLKIKGISKIKFEIKKIKDVSLFCLKNGEEKGNVEFRKELDFSFKNTDNYESFFIDFNKLKLKKGLSILTIKKLKLPSDCKKLENIKSRVKFWKYLINPSNLSATVLSLNGGTLIRTFDKNNLANIPKTNFKFFKSGKLSFKTQTDKNGFSFVKKRINISRWYYGRRGIFLLEKEKDIAYSYVNSSWISGGGFFRNSKLAYKIFTDREYYLPGEDIHIAGIFKIRWRNKLSGLRNRNITLFIEDPTTKIIKKQSLRLDYLGGFYYTFKTKKSFKRGEYYFYVKAKNWKTDYITVNLDFFKPNIIEVKQNIEKEEIVSNGKNRVNVKGSYLNGAPMSEDKVYVNLKFSSYSWFFVKKLKEEFKNYRFTPPFFSKKAKRKTLKFNEKGELSFVVDPSKYKIPSLSKVSVETIGVAKDGKEYSARSGFYYYSSDSIVGIKVPYFVKAGKKIKVGFIALNSKGNLTESNAIISISRKFWSEKKYKTENVFKGSFHFKGKLDKSFNFKKPGHYRIEVISKDSKGFTTTTIADFYVWDYDYSFVSNKRKKIEIKFEKGNYKVGDTARAFISFPSKGEGMIILFTEEVEEKHILEFTKTSEFSFKIRESFYPSIGFLVVYHYKDKNGERKTLSAYKTIKVNNKAKEIKVNLSMKDELLPSKEYKVKIKTTNFKNKGVKSELFVYAVDEGVLSLSGYETPNPVSALYEPYSYSYLLYDTFSRKDFFPLTSFYGERFVVGARRSVRFSKSLGGKVEERIAPIMMKKEKTKVFSGKDIRIRNLFKSTLFFKKIKTDKYGNAVLRFKTSDLLSTYRLVAIAYSKDMFGSSDKRFVVSKKLLMKESFPDFLRKGDKVKAGVILTNRSKKTLKINVFTETDNKIRILGKSKKSIILKPMHSKTVFFETEAVKEGNSLIKFYAISGNFKDGLEKKVEIKKNIIKESVVDFSSGKNIIKKYILNKEKEPELSLSFSPSLINYSYEIAKKLIIYPYECLEQRTSKIIPYLILSANLSDYGVANYNRKQVKREIKKYLKKLPSFLNSDGGVGYYENGRSSKYLTIYVLYALKLIKDKGFEIDNNIIKKMFDYLEYENLSDSTKAFYLYVKSLWGKNIDGEISELYKHYENLPLLSKAFLLRSISRSNFSDKNKSIKKIINDFEKSMFIEADFAYFKDKYSYDWFEFPFYSNKYLSAVILSSILEAKINYVLAPRIIKYLIEKKSTFWWNTTHVNIWILEALAIYVRKVEKSYRKNVVLEIFENSNSVLKKSVNFVHPKQKYTKIFKSFKKSKELLLKASSSSLFYLTSELNQNANLEKLENRGFEIRRRIYNEKGQQVHELKKGEIYQVVLEIKTQEPMDYVVIDEPLIGGVQLLRKDIKTTRKLFDFRKDKKKYYYWWWGVKRKEYRKDKIIFYAYRIQNRFEISYYIKALYKGIYNLLPVSVFSMYHPQYRGRNKKAIIEIK